MPQAIIRNQLREGVRRCGERGLFHSTKWYLLGLEETEPINIGDFPFLDLNTLELAESEVFQEPQVADRYQLAKSYFDLREFDRCSYTLRDASDNKSRFLKLYAKYLSGEKKKEEKNQDIMGLADEKRILNENVSEILEDLEPLYLVDELDSFCLYLYALILLKKNMEQKAVDALVKSLNKYPYNWSAWLELSGCISNQDTLEKILPELNNHFMAKFFVTHTANELHFNTELIQQDLELLLCLFPGSDYLKTQKAMHFYNTREFDEAEAIFDELIEKDPFRLDNLDTYSNVLYVMEKKAKLSFLAHNSACVDKYRPETCCIIGNYFSLKGEHEKAVIHFKRALKLNRKYLSAWTLMGHEYVEMKNTHAAIEAYRRAVDINTKDYRAWYGLGQTYEVLRMPYYSLYYYQRATALRPYDARMWCALAGCYEILNQDVEAIKCYKRALLGSENEVIALNKLGNLYKKLDQQDTAAYYYHLSLKQTKIQDNHSIDLVETCLFLAYYEKKRGNFKEAEEYVTEVLKYNGPEKEEAKALLRELRNCTKASNALETPIHSRTVY
ncbi:anaphase-promoting complex subunit Apc8 [Basidiobolus meristosporus CBS 931.73]|uniref:Anaphase-promoting complex subunit Apc8 n=1 Tax=Basidiobolus meristosporus CBS 931.73 TaxID=1314790 RepID=A0A1Y1Y4H9_9FUNG|nr:anaphase-promoting complex subunit Apc8 [Basidiobolus meristosporus CBS 931.73]|eukprot:ORX92888.1 anaphase-promoting complex subunit Apc8 [Basidiobolus meristosporus CBS 931.73]